MIKIDIKYQPVSWLKYYRKIECHFPEQWEELSPKQFIVVATAHNTRLSAVSFLTAMLGIKKHIVKKLPPYYQYKLMNLFEKFLGDKPFSEFIISQLEIEGVIFYSPLPKLKKMTFGQFMFVENYFEHYNYYHTEEYLHKFLAALFIASDKTFSDTTVDSYHAFFTKLDYLTKEAILTNYHLISAWLHDAYPLIFIQSPKTDKNETEKPQQAKPPQYYWTSVFEKIIQDDIVNTEKYSKLPVHTVLRFLTNNIKQSMKSK